MTRSHYQRSATDRQAAERGARVAAEHRRIRRQYTRALDRRLSDDWPDGHGAYRPDAAARIRERIAAELQFADHARQRLTDVLRCLDWADADEVLRRLDSAVAALHRHLDPDRRDNA